MDAATTTPRLQERRDGGVLMQRMVRWLRRKGCRHEFRYDGLKTTGIQEQERPAPNASYADWMKWHQSRAKDPVHTQRVSWPCVKCGEMFYAHCGLDILRHGKIMPPNDKSDSR